jgi:peptide/nickel transport system permease protein
MRILRYIFRRLLLSIPVLLGVTIATFVTTRLMPGSPVERMVHALDATPEQMQALMAHYGYDKPVYVQYVRYLRDITRGDFGVSFTTGKNVFEDINSRLMPTFELTIYSLIVAMGIGIPLGLLAALKQNSAIDHAVRVLSVIGVAAPAFWVAMLLVYIFFAKLHWAAPPIGRLPALMTPPDHITGFYTLDAVISRNWPALRASFRALILPVATLGLGALAPIARMTRNEAVEVMSSRFVITARALGLDRRAVLQHHVLKNTLLPVLTLSGIIFGYLLGGVVVVESVFSWPGLGFYAFNAASGSDYPAVQGFALYTSIIYISIFLILDILYAFLDPRIRH